jgi:hypothetical protein
MTMSDRSEHFDVSKPQKPKVDFPLRPEDPTSELPSGNKGLRLSASRYIRSIHETIATVLNHHPVARKIAVAGLCIMALVSIAQGFHNAMLSSQDFQWSPTVILARDGDDPYQSYLDNPRSPTVASAHDGDDSSQTHLETRKSDRIILTQIPNYAHFTYLMLIPFAFLSFSSAKIAWALANLAFIAGSYFLLRRRFGGRALTIGFLIFLCSTPARNSIGIGQQSLFCFFLYIAAALAWARPHQSIAATKYGAMLSSLVAGIGAFKFSFGVPLFFALDLSRLRNALLYLVPATIGILFWALFFKKGLIESALLPLRVAQTGTPLGAADLQSMLKSLELPAYVTYTLPLFALLAVVCLQRLFVPLDEPFKRLSFYGIVSLMLFFHLPYDQVFLLGCFLLAFEARSYGVRIAIFSITAYFWFGAKAMNLVTITTGYIALNHALLWILLIALAYEFRLGASPADRRETPLRDGRLTAATAAVM